MQSFVLVGFCFVWTYIFMESCLMGCKMKEAVTIVTASLLQMLQMLQMLRMLQALFRRLVPTLGPDLVLIRSLSAKATIPSEH